MRSADLRAAFLSFFEDRGHTVMPSSPLVPHGDSSVLFTIAGMVQFKSYFLGQVEPTNRRMTSCQKCFRTEDLELVGFTPRHDTFFEMLGNFSIGDYYKEEAIAFAWEFLTKTLALDPARMWPTVHPDDERARTQWRAVAGYSDERIVSLEENFWEMGKGLAGPCGFDSEVHWDTGTPCSCGRPNCPPGCDGTRWIEIWNLVFMEFDRAADGSMTPLPRPSIDTGMGMERVTTVSQGVGSIFETDLFEPIRSGFISRSPNPDPSLAAWNVLADHIRAATFLVADGVMPGNEGRGYVLRRLLRRAALFGRRANMGHGMVDGVADVISVMGGLYPDLSQRRGYIEGVISTEETAFAATLDGGLHRLDSLIEQGGTLSGEDAFRLHDTYGLPIEVTREVAGQRGVALDEEGFAALFEEQRQRSRQSRVDVHHATMDQAVRATHFVGYEELSTQSTVVAIHPALDPAASDDVRRSSQLVFLEPSPFYAEAGGQVGDTGELTWDDGRALVLDTFYVGEQLRAHAVRVVEGELAQDASVIASVDGERRARVAVHHSATHLLHRSLRDVLGESAVQRGSYVGPDHATFDFSFPRALTPEEIAEVERRTNAAVRANYVRELQLLSIDEARKSGAVALFGEKYGDTVRVIDFGGWARELCGGTHVQRAGDVGAVVLASESSVGQGVRRITMRAGYAAVEEWRHDRTTLRAAAHALKARPDEVPGRVSQLQEQLRAAERVANDPGRHLGEDVTQGTARSEWKGHPLIRLDLAEADGRVVGAAADRLVGDAHETAMVVVIGRDTVAAKRAGGDEPSLDAAALVAELCAAGGGKGGGKAAFARGGFDASRRHEVAARLTAMEEGVGAGNGTK